LGTLHRYSRWSALKAAQEQLGQFVGVDPRELVAPNYWKVSAQDELRLVVDGGDGAGETGINGDVTHGLLHVYRGGAL
jgi:hypothetical protein